MLDLTWRETRGPQVAAPERQGYGTRLIARSLAAELGGRAELTFAAEGLRCRLTAAVVEDEPPSI
jgi:chemotaxis family two-component system sensor kinase Cph1